MVFALFWVAIDCLLFAAVDKFFGRLQRSQWENGDRRWCLAELALLCLIGAAVQRFHHNCTAFWMLTAIGCLRLLPAQRMPHALRKWLRVKQPASYEPYTVGSPGWLAGSSKQVKSPDGRMTRVECIYGIPRSEYLRRPLKADKS